MGVRALDGASLTVGRGEIVGIMGRSGSGKSTLLHILGCLDRPDSGRVWIDGTEVTRLSDAALPRIRLNRLGFVFQSHNLVPTLTALENVALPLRYVRPRPKDPYGQAKAMLEAVGLADRMHHLPGQLSGGQQQRVALARAIAMRPKVLLFDEPLSNLDAQLRERMRIELRSLQQSLGITAVYVTHDQAEAMAISDRIVLMREGSVVQVGSPAVMYRQPATAYAADFLGSVNFIPARYDGEGRTQMILASDKAVPLTISLPREVSRGSRVLLGIRPEDVLINERDDVNTFRAKVVNAVFLGASWHVELSLEGTRIRASVPSRVFPEGVPEECTVTLSPSRLMYIPVDDMGVLPGENR